MTDLGSGNTASFTHTNEVSKRIMTMLVESDTAVGYAVLGCALTLGRLFSPDKVRSDEDEITFIENLTEWCGAYWQNGGLN